MAKVENHYVALMFPLVVFAFWKTGYGIRWVLKRFKRTALQTYYLQSWAFYTSYFAQQAFLLIWTWDIFNDQFRILTLICMFACFPLHIVLTIYMKYVDMQNRRRNDQSKDLSVKKRLSKLMSEQDRLLIQSHVSQQQHLSSRGQSIPASQRPSLNP